MKLTEQIKQNITKEYNEWFTSQYGGKTLEERRKLGAFFTPPELTIKMIEQMSCDSLEGKTILDPTAGAGGLIAGCILAGADPKLCYCNEYDQDILDVCRSRLGKLGVPYHNMHKGDANCAYDVTISNFGPNFEKNRPLDDINSFKEDLW